MAKILEASGYKMGTTGLIPTSLDGKGMDARTREQEKVLMTLDGMNDLVQYVIIEPMETGMEMISSVPGVDTVGDPLLALYFTKKASLTGDLEDKASAIAYTTGIFVPFASGAVIKLTGTGAAQLLKKSTTYDFKITGRVRDDIMNSIDNPKLKDFFGELYRPNASIENGGTAAAVLEEGVGGRHWQKAHDKLQGLKDLVSGKGKYKGQVLTDDDQKIANQLIKELKEAIETANKNAYD